MNSWKGTITGTGSAMTDINVKEDQTSERMTVVNKTGGNVVVNVYMKYPNGEILISPKDVLLEPGDALVDEQSITIIKGEQMKIQVVSGGGVDYHVSFY